MEDLWSKSQPGDDVSPDPGAGLDGLPGPLRGVVDGEGEEVVDEHGRLHHAHPHRRGDLLRRGGGGRRTALVLVAHRGSARDSEMKIVEVTPSLLLIIVLEFVLVLGRKLSRGQ